MLDFEIEEILAAECKRVKCCIPNHVATLTDFFVFQDSIVCDEEDALSYTQHIQGVQHDQQTKPAMDRIFDKVSGQGVDYDRILG